MFIWLPLLAFFFVYRLLRGGSGRTENPHVFVETCLAFGVLLWAITEILSLVDGLTAGWVALAWGGVCAGAAWGCLRRRSGFSQTQMQVKMSAPLSPDDPTDALAGGLRVVMMGGLLALAALGLAAGYFYPPNGADAVEYHLPRALHHIQNQNVAHYPTTILRQIQFPPLSEYAVAQALLLGGGWVRWAAGVQWLAWVMLFGVAGSLARELGARSVGQWLAAMLVATTPMAILQASAIGNDLVLALWMACLCYAIIRYAREANWRNALAIGAGFGLALCTKGTAFVLCFPLVVWVAGLLVTDARRRVLQISTAAALALLISASYWGRNLDTFGDPLGHVVSGERRHGYANELHTPAAITSNLVRNIGIHARVNFNPRFHPRFLRFRTAVHDWLGIGENDARTTLGMVFPLAFAWTDWGDEDAGNPLQFILFLLAGVGAVWFWRKYHRRELGWYALLLAGMFFFFCIVLKFQTHNARLQLPLFMLAAPFVGAVIGAGHLRLKEWLVWALVAGLFGAAVPVALYHNSRPLAGQFYPWERSERSRYHVRNERFLREYVDVWMAAGEAVQSRGIRQVGLVCGAGEDEYFLWAGLKKAGGENVRVVHVLVKNPSQDKEAAAMSLAQCDAVLAIIPEKNIAALSAYTEVWRSALQGEAVLVLLQRKSAVGAE